MRAPGACRDQPRGHRCSEIFQSLGVARWQAAQLLAAGASVDINNDGLDDCLVALGNAPRGTDSDGVADYRDLDSDNDSIPDLVEVSGSDQDGDATVGDFMDDNGDGHADEMAALLQSGLPDTDRDQIPDYQKPFSGASVKTGTQGNGCSIDVVEQAADPAGLLWLLGALAGLWRQRHVRRSTVFRHGLNRAGAHRVGAHRVGGAGRRCRRLVQGTLTGLLVASSVQAAPAADTDFERRVYAGAGFGQSRLSPTTEGTEFRVDQDGDTSLHLHLGYDITPRFSGELVLGSLGDATLQPRGSIGYQVFSFSGLAYVGQQRTRELREGLAGYVRGGLGVMNNSAENVDIEKVNGVHLLLGVGGEYGLDNGLAVRGELISFAGDASAVQLALLYRFDTARGRDAWPAPSQTGQSRPSASPAPGPGAEDTRESASESAPDQNQQRAPVAEPAPGTQAPDARAPQAPRSQAPAPAPAPPRATADADGDGVPNTRDLCPNASGGGFIDDVGCPYFGGVIKAIKFAPGTDQLLPTASAALDRLVTGLQRYPAVGVQLAVHVADTEDEQAEKALSRQRVLTVARYLVVRGIPAQRLSARAFGSSQPLVSNTTPAGRARNERVEVTVQ